MAAVAITTIVALGTLGYEYFGVKDSRASEAQVMATRLTQLLLEDWKSTGGDADYDPKTLGLGFVTPPPPATSTCMITLDNQTFYIQLTQGLVAIPNNPDPATGARLIRINVTTRWRVDYAPGAITADDPSISLTTYIRRDT